MFLSDLLSMIFLGPVVAYVLYHTDAVSFIVRSRILFVKTFILMLGIFVLFGQWAGNTLWLRMGGIGAFPLEALLYPSLACMSVIVADVLGNAKKQDTAILVTMRCLFAVLLAVYYFSFAKAAITGERTGMFTRSSSLVGLYAALGIMISARRGLDCWYRK